jgi:hypothetical protein
VALAHWRLAHWLKPATQCMQACATPGPQCTAGGAVKQYAAEHNVDLRAVELDVAADADVADVARAIVKVVDMPFGKRPFRIHIDPAQDGAEIVNGVADRIREEMYRNIGLADLLKPVSS